MSFHYMPEVQQRDQRNYYVQEAERRYPHHPHRFDKRVTVLESKVWGFDVWYADYSPCIVALQPDGNVTVGVQDVETAEKMFGPGEVLARKARG